MIALQLPEWPSRNLDGWKGLLASLFVLALLVFTVAGTGCARGTSGAADTLQRIGGVAHDAACKFCSYVAPTCGGAELEPLSQ